MKEEKEKSLGDVASESGQKAGPQIHDHNSVKS